MKIAQTSLPSFFKTLQAQQHPKVILLYGTEENLILETVHQVKVALKSFVFESISAEGEYLSTLANELLTSSMFGESKILHTHNFRKLDGKKITDLLSKITPSSPHILILSHPTTLEATNSIRKFCEKDNHFVAIPIYTQTQAGLKQSAKTCLDALNLEYEPPILELLSQMFSGNASAMKQELAKLQIYLISSPQKITPQLLQKVIQGSTQENVFEIPTFLFSKNLKKTLQIIQHAQNQEESPVLPFTAISLYVKKLYNVKQELTKGENIETLLRKNAIFVNQAEAFKQQISSLSLKKISTIIQNLNTLEAQTRQSPALAYSYLKNFAIRLCNS